MLLHIFKSMLITSAAGSVLILLLLLLKPLTKRFFGAVWQYYIWFAVLAVMMMPITIGIVKSEPQAAKAGILNETVELQSEVQPQEGIEAQISEETQMLPKTAEEKPISQHAKEAFKESYLKVIASIPYIWFVGAVLIFILKMVEYLMFLSAIKKNSVIISCPQISENKIMVQKTNMIDSPLMIGLFKPVILIPDIKMTEETLNNVLLHELVHYRRHDILYKWVAMLVNTVHWFNPFAYLVSKQIDNECEISCDLVLAQSMTTKEKNSYMNTILTLLSQNQIKKQMLTTAMASNKNQIKRRFTMIKKATKKSKIISLVSVAAAILIFTVSVFASGVLSSEVNGGEASGSKVITSGNKTNILLMGIDNDAKLPDTIMILSLDDERKSFTVMSIPRNTLIVDDKENKISGLYDGNYKNIVNAIQKDLKLPVDYYAEISLEGFRNIVDILGGIEFDVPMKMSLGEPADDFYVSLEKGRQLLDGAKAEALIRHRKSYVQGDMTRIEVGRNFVAEIIKQTADLKYISKANKLYDEISKNLQTDYPLTKALKDMKTIEKIDAGNINSFTLPGKEDFYNGTNYYVLNKEETEIIVQKYFAK